MRNLKRALSLVMAAAMLIGMMVVSASAADNYEDFTDKDEIQNTEAVATMVSLGVFNGKEDGSYFDPTGIVTRAEMAKIIAVSLNGGKDPVLGSGAATTQFSDTKGNWAEAYIAYCANLGIINGKGDGTFGPNEPVTGTAAAKMFLTALGYRSDIEKLTGTGWDLNTDRLANEVGLYDGLGHITPSNGLSRDDTAQLVYNGVQAQEVEYRNNYGEYSGVIYPQDSGTMLANRFKVIKVEGMVEANDVFALDGVPAQAGKTRITTSDVYKNAAGNYITSTDAYTVSVPNEMVGTRVVIYVQFKNNLSPNAVDSVVVGTAISSDKNTIVETNGRLKNADAVKSALKGSGLAVSLYEGYSEITITEKDQSETHYTSSNTWSNGAGTKGEIDLAGVVQRFIDNNGDSKVDLIIREIPVLSKVSSYNTKDEKMTLTGVGSVDFDEVANYDEVEKDDYVLAAKYSDTYYLTVVEPVSGKVEAYNSGNYTITVDGTKYAASAGTDLTTLDNFTATGHGKGGYATTMSEMVNNTYDLYLDKGGNILAYEEVEEALGNYALVLNSGSENDMLGNPSGKVKLLMQDGTTGTYDVNLLASAKRYGVPSSENTNAKKEAWMAVQMSNNGIQYHVVAYSLDSSTVTLTAPDQFSSNRYGKAVDNAAQAYASNVSNYNYNGTYLMADNSTIFFLRNSDGTHSVATGLKSIPTGGLTTNNNVTGGFGTAIYAKPTNATYKTNTAKAVFLSIDTVYASTASYAYVSGDYSKTVVDGEDIFTYPVVLEDGSTTTLSTKTPNASKKNVYEYTTDSKGYVSFDETGKTINGVIVTLTGNGTVDLEQANNEGVVVGSHPISGSIAVWNVEDTNDIYDTQLARRTVSALVLDKDGYVKTAFVIEIRDAEMTGMPTALTATATDVPGGTASITGASGADLTDGKDLNLTDVEVGDTITVSQNIPTTQNIRIKIGDTYVAGTASTWVTGTGGAVNATAYTITAEDLAAGNVVITTTISPVDTDSDEINRVITNVVNLSKPKAAALASTVVTISDKTDNSKTLAVATGEISTGSNVAAVTEAAAGDEVIITVTTGASYSTAATAQKVVINVKNAEGEVVATATGASVAESGTAALTWALKAENIPGTYTVEVVLEEENATANTVTYTEQLTVAAPV